MISRPLSLLGMLLLWLVLTPAASAVAVQSTTEVDERCERMALASLPTIPSTHPETAAAKEKNASAAFFFSCCISLSSIDANREHASSLRIRVRPTRIDHDDPVNHIDPMGLDWEWTDDHWREIPGTPWAPEPIDGFTPKDNGGSTTFTRYDIPNLVNFGRAKYAGLEQAFVDQWNPILAKGPLSDVDQFLYDTAAARLQAEAQGYAKRDAIYLKALDILAKVDAEYAPKIQRLQTTRTWLLRGIAVASIPVTWGWGSAAIASATSLTARAGIAFVASDAITSSGLTAVRGEFTPGLIFRAGNALAGTKGGVAAEITSQIVAPHVSLPSFEGAILRTEMTAIGGNAPGVQAQLFHSAMTDGPLPAGIAATFENGAYQIGRIGEGGEVLYRAGVAGKPFGQFFGREEPISVLQTRLDRAVLPFWPGGGVSPLDTAFGMRFPAGTVFYSGKIAPQELNGLIYPGGAEQIVILKPWLLEDAVEMLNPKKLPLGGAADNPFLTGGR